MRCLIKRMVIVSLIITMIIVAMTTVSSAEERVIKIVLFHEDVSWQEIDRFALEWQVHNAVVLMRLPLVHGLVLLTPPHILSADLADDPRVVSVEDNRRLKVDGAGGAHTVIATADGGAADGGAADGGAADGGAADGGAADGGAADGGARIGWNLALSPSGLELYTARAIAIRWVSSLGYPQALWATS